MKRSPSTATDHIYLHREVRFLLDDGTVMSSRDVNFHGVPLRRVIELRCTIRNRDYRIRKADLPPTFVEFLHFRSTGRDFRVNPATGLHEMEPTNSWTIGWTDGTTEFLMEIDFQTGEMIGSYERPAAPRLLPTHWHPDSRVLERGTR